MRKAKGIWGQVYLLGIRLEDRDAEKLADVIFEHFVILPTFQNISIYLFGI